MGSDRYRDPATCRDGLVKPDGSCMMCGVAVAGHMDKEAQECDRAMRLLDRQEAQWEEAQAGIRVRNRGGGG